jgi:hypothetical protein
VYTKTDGIVDWRVCVNDDPSTNVEVQSTHIGLVFNPWVYELIAERLAKKESWTNGRAAKSAKRSVPAP